MVMICFPRKKFSNQKKYCEHIPYACAHFGALGMPGHSSWSLPFTQIEIVTQFA